jgi:hypothetical protein
MLSETSNAGFVKLISEKVLGSKKSRTVLNASLLNPRISRKYILATRILTY